MSINKYKILIFVLLIFVVGCSNNQINNNVNTYETKSIGSTQAGDVLIELTPLNIKENKLNIKIDINTHNIDLSQFDLKELTTLEYNNIKIKPVEVPNLKGHHSSGILVFDVRDTIKGFTIKIRGIPNIEERIFKWN